MAKSTFVFDEGLARVIDVLDDRQLLEPFSTISAFKQLIFTSSIDYFRWHLIKLLHELYFKHPELMPEKLVRKVGGREIKRFIDHDFYEDLDDHYRGKICSVADQIKKELQVEIFKSRLAAIRMTRLFEMRNCIVHYNGQKSAKFFRTVGSKLERARSVGQVTVPHPYMVLPYIARSMIHADLAFCSKYELDRALSSQ